MTRIKRICKGEESNVDSTTNNNKKNKKDNKEKDNKDKDNKDKDKEKDNELIQFFFVPFNKNNYYDDNDNDYDDCDDCDYDPYSTTNSYEFLDEIEEKKRKNSKRKKPNIIISDEDTKIFNDILKIKPKNVDQLLEIAKVMNNLFNKYPSIDHTNLNVNEYKWTCFDKIAKMEKELSEISSMIGMAKIKEQFVTQIAYLLSEYKTEMLMHTIISGEPGTGKTTIAKLIGSAYHKSGILKSNAFVCATRRQLVGKYIGHTAHNTTDMFNKAKGGVIFIDEVYSLGNPSDDKIDSFSKEAIDTINQLLSERTDTMCIVAGYADEIEKAFISNNRGLESRFPWKFEIEKYNADDLYAMFNLYIKNAGWTIEEPDKYINVQFFKDNNEHFKFYGRDITTFLTKCYMQHTLRLFLEQSNKVLSNEDLRSAFEIFKQNKAPNKIEEPEHWRHIYV